MTLDELRAKIDKLDGDVLRLLNERATLALEIAEIKRASQTSFYVPEREKAILDRLRARNEGPLSDEAVKAIYREVMSSIRALEKEISVGFLGPRETFSHMAAMRVFGVTASRSCSMLIVKPVLSSVWTYTGLPSAIPTISG